MSAIDDLTGKRVRPRCAVCGTFVERFDEVQDTFLERVVFTAYCHGDVERVEVAFSEMPASIDFAEAFRSPRRLSR